MGKVQYGGGITAITGSIGGWSFQTNRSGAIVRVRGGTLRNSTQKQTAAHQHLVAFQKGWQQLTSEQQVGWNAFADTNQRTDRYGVKKIITGLNWFASINYYLDLVGEPTITTAPVYTIPVAVQSYNLAVRTSDIILGFEPEFDPANNALLIFTTPYTSRITTSQRQNMRLTKVITAGPYSTINLTSDWENTHGMPWPPSGPPICGYVGVMVQTVNKASGISSTALLKTNGLTSGEEGIGFMSIGNDFIVKANPAHDVSAQLFINAVYDAGGTLTNLEENAINTYVLDAKNNANPWWDNTLGDYPMVGATKDSCKINLKNPGTFDLNFVNTIAGNFTSNGWQPNGLDSYADTGIIPLAELIIQSVTFEYYSRQNISESYVDMGCRNTSSSTLQFQMRLGIAFRFVCYNSNGLINITNSDTLGSHIATRVASNDLRLFKRGLQIGNTVTSSGGNQPSRSIFISAFNNNGVPSSFASKQSAGNLIGDGFSPAQALAQSLARQLMNTTLSRQV